MKMSCNGCRVLRKGCSEDCMLRDCLTWIQNPQAQANATVFVTKFFGRATLMSFLSPIPPNQRSCLFQSLMYEAVGRTINPVNGAVGLLWTGKWQFCQLGVEQVLRGNGGALKALPDQLLGVDHESSSVHHQYHQQQEFILGGNCNEEAQSGLISHSRVVRRKCNQAEKQRAGTHESEESESSTLGSRTETEDCSYVYAKSQTHRNQLLTLFL